MDEMREWSTRVAYFASNGSAASHVVFSNEQLIGHLVDTLTSSHRHNVINANTIHFKMVVTL